MTYSEQMLDQLEAGKLKEAQNSFKLALINDDDDMLFSLAEELYALGFLQQARTIYLKLLDRYPDEDELKTNLATIAIDEGHNDEALSYLAQIKPDSPAYVQSLLVAADLYQTEEEFEVTEEKLKEAYALAPDEPAVEFALGEFYFMVGQYSEAIQYYFQLIKNGYTDFAKVDIAGRLGICYAQSGQFKKALGYFNQVKPEYQTSDIRFQKGLTQLQLGDTEKAIKTLEDLINDDNQYASAYPELAKAYEKENKYQQALRVVQEGLSVDQYNEYLYSLAAEITAINTIKRISSPSLFHPTRPLTFRISNAISGITISRINEIKYAFLFVNTFFKSIPPISIPITNILAGPIIAPTELSVPVMISGRRIFAKNKVIAMIIVMILILKNIFFRLNPFS